MSLVFDGSDTKVQNDGAAGFDSDAISIAGWINLDSSGEFGFGRIMTLDEDENAVALMITSGYNMRFYYEFSGNGGAWEIGPLSTDTWYAFAVSFDGSDPSNNPVMYLMEYGVDSSLASQSVSEISTPSGSGFRLILVIVWGTYRPKIEPLPARWGTSRFGRQSDRWPILITPPKIPALSNAARLSFTCLLTATYWITALMVQTVHSPAAAAIRATRR